MIRLFIQSVYPAAYRVGVFSELNKYFDIFVVFETKTGDKRNNKFFIKEFDFNYCFLDEQKGKKKYIRELKKLKEYDYVIAYDYSSKSSMRLILKCILNRMPYLINCDGAILKDDKFLKKFVKIFFISRSIACLANGKSAEEYFKKYGAKSENIYQHKFSSLYKRDILKKPISLEEKDNLKKKLNLNYKKIFISVGSFIYGKGYDILIEAVKQIKNINGVGFIIIGGGEELENYRKKIKEYNINNIEFIDFLPKERLIEYYDCSDIFIFPTRGDIWGLVINEAMSRGLPVISTDKCIAGNELIKNGFNGEVIKTGNVEELQKVINKYCNIDRRSLRTLGIYSLTTIKNYNIESIADSHKEVIELLNRSDK